MVEHSHLEMCSLTSLLIRRVLPGSLSSACLLREFAPTPSACNLALQLDLEYGPLSPHTSWTQSSSSHNWSIADHNTPSLELKNMPAIWQGSINMVNYQRALLRLEETAKSQVSTVPTGTAIHTISASDERE